MRRLLNPIPCEDSEKERDMSDRAQIFKCRIDWSDLDLLGHVNNIAFSRFIQAAGSVRNYAHI